MRLTISYEKCGEIMESKIDDSKLISWVKDVILCNGGTMDSILYIIDSNNNEYDIVFKLLKRPEELSIWGKQKKRK